MFHRREIDGLRAFAILPVLFYHADFSWMPGGFFGVDVFFVISGFLITMILLNELDNTGRISIIGFYERRARRILPALFTVILVSLVVGWFVLFTDEFKLFLKSCVSILYFGSNYFFLGQTDYFASDIDLHPMVHTWSLAIEEQFYLFFPLILWALWRAVGKKLLVPVLVFIGLASLALAVLWQGNPSESFYLLQFRAWELLAGSLAAIALSKRDFKPISNQWLSLLGFLAILGSVFFLDNSFQHPGLITLVPILGACLVIMFAGDKTWVQSVLNLKVFVGIGLISYSAYLWHQPLFAFVRSLRLHSPDAMLYLLLIAITLVLAALSWKYVENPVRNRKRFSRKMIFTGTTALTILVLGITFIADRKSLLDTRTTPFSGVEFSEVDDSLAPNKGLNEHCREFVGDDPTCSTGRNPKVLLWGDSHAMHLAQWLSSSQTKVHFTQQTRSGCSPILGQTTQNKSQGKVEGLKCITHNSKVFNWLRTQPNIQVVILASPWDENLGPKRQILDESGSISLNGTSGIERLGNTIAAIKSLGKKVVLMAPIPRNIYDTGKCLALAKLSGVEMATCNFPQSLDIHKKVKSYFLKVSRPSEIILLSQFICPKGVCEASKNGIFIYRDAGHLSVQGSKLLGEKYDLMGEVLKAAR